MQRIAVDSSVIVAALAAWHEHHEPGLEALQSVLVSDDELVIPARVLIEVYSVLTRLPTPHRLAPEVALQSLQRTLADTTVIGLPPSASWGFLEKAVASDVRGGAIYDAEILASAREAGAEEILTFNRAHFERMAPAGLRVVVPGPPER